MNSLRLFRNILRDRRWIQWLSLMLMLLAAVVLGVSALQRSLPAHPEKSLARFTASVESRMGQLEEAIDQMLESGTLPEDRTLPEDMVLYYYRNDSLIRWRNQFPLYDDAIGSSVVPTPYRSFSPALEQMDRLRRRPASPLRQVGEVPVFVNFGSRWYFVMARRAESPQRTVIGGLLVKDVYQETVNPRLYYDDSFDIQPLDYGSELIVNYGDTPLCSFIPLVSEGMQKGPAWPLWTALALGVLGAILYLRARRRFRRYLPIVLGLSLVFWLLNSLGQHFQGAMSIFSPVTYAGSGGIIYSLGSLVLLNLYLLLMVGLTYLVRRPLFRWALREGKERWRTLVLGAGSLAVLLLLCWHIHRSFFDLGLNSGIFLQLMQMRVLSSLTAIVYLSFLTLCLALPMAAQFLRPALRYCFHFRFDALSRIARIVFVTLTAAYFLIAAAVIGQRKEEQVAISWASRIAMDRDINLELRLRRAEQNIASDRILTTLVYDGDDNMVFQQVRDVSLRAVSQAYDVETFRIPDDERANPVYESLMQEWVDAADPIAPGSAFLFSTDGRGRSRYAGVFHYQAMVSGKGLTLLIAIEAKSNKDDRGYQGLLLGLADRGTVQLPPSFGFARYRYGELIASSGSFSFSLLLPERYKVRQSDGGHFVDTQARSDIRYVNCVSPDEVVVIVRPKVPLSRQIFAGFLLAFALYLALGLIHPTPRSLTGLDRNYFNVRIQTVFYASLLAVVVAVAVFSTYYIDSRSRDEHRELMAARITSVQERVQERLRSISSLQEVSPSQLSAMLEEIALTYKSDIVLYTPEGKVWRSTSPELFRQMLIGNRMNDRAYESLRMGNERYCIVSETLRGSSFKNLYAPVHNAAGSTIAYISTPYIGDTSRYFSAESMVFVLSILAIFLMLLLIVRASLRAFLSRMFRPIVDIGRKMDATDVTHLEYIDYERDDEISTLVRAYNRMVQELTDSTRRLAQAERDRAWSEMARQVAHEIKNPLTPIKLRLQMLIRMKESGNPAWTEKFDEAAGVVLEHIDILADTASQFSTFARLYSEDPVEIDLDALIKEEVELFDTRENITIRYFGLEGARIDGPKPQLTRVLVNLITNAIQAVEERPEPGQIVISLRHSSYKDQFYDIVVEDNGPGVKPEHQEMLFTPNFTTKNRGTGLGLAICRSIIDRCGGEIVYSRSFALGGACFTIHYPKKSLPL